jgi:hypothetical protein
VWSALDESDFIESTKGYLFEIDGDWDAYAGANRFFPVHAKKGYPTPIFSLERLAHDSVSLEQYPLVRWDVDLTAGTFFYTQSLLQSFVSNFERLAGGYQWTYVTANVRTGVLIDVGAANILTFEFDDASQTTFLVPLDADKLPVVSDELNADYVLNRYDTQNEYGYSISNVFPIIGTHATMFLRSDRVKFVMVGIVPKNNCFIRKMNVYASHASAKLVTEEPPTLVFSLEDLVYAPVALKQSPLLRWDVDLTAGTFSYTQTLLQTFVDNFVPVSGGYQWTFASTNSRTGVLVDVGSAKTLTFEFDDASQVTYFVPLDADKLPIVSDEINDDYVLDRYDAQTTYGYSIYNVYPIIAKHTTMKLLTNRVKFVMVGIVPKNNCTISKMNIYASRSSAVLVTE